MLRKSLTKYLEEQPKAPVDKFDYELAPAVAFLKQTVHHADAINMCRKRFQRKKDGSLWKDGAHALNILGCATLASIMGNFETFERNCFAGLFELTEHLPNYDIRGCVKKLKDETNLTIDVVELAAYRGNRAATGTILADQLGNWHTPRKVNAYFKAILNQVSGFTADDCHDLEVLWQLRHSIVHTAGTMTRPDAQKVPGLKILADQAIVVDINFIDAVVRRFHKIVKHFVEEVHGKLRALAGADYTGQLMKNADAFLKVESPRVSWFKY